MGAGRVFACVCERQRCPVVGSLACGCEALGAAARPHGSPQADVCTPESRELCLSLAGRRRLCQRGNLARSLPGRGGGILATSRVFCLSFWETGCPCRTDGRAGQERRRRPAWQERCRAEHPAAIARAWLELGYRRSQGPSAWTDGTEAVPPQGSPGRQRDGRSCTLGSGTDWGAALWEGWDWGDACGTPTLDSWGLQWGRCLPLIGQHSAGDGGGNGDEG